MNSQFNIPQLMNNNFFKFFSTSDEIMDNEEANHINNDEDHNNNNDDNLVTVKWINRTQCKRFQTAPTFTALMAKIRRIDPK